MPTTFGLAPRYWRKRLLDAAKSASTALAPAAGEPNPADEAAVAPLHPLDEHTPELRHVVVDMAKEEHRHRHARDRAEIIVVLVALAATLLVASSLSLLP